MLPIGMDNNLIYKEADALLHQERPEAIDKALALLRQVTEHDPSDAKAWFEFAGGYDFLGREEEALPFYKKAYEIGFDKLPLEDQPRLFVQMGSTLRNLKKYGESRKILLEGTEMFPKNAAIKAFLGLTEYSNGSYRQAAKYFLSATLAEPGDESLRDYGRALRFYTEKLDTFPVRQRNWMRMYLHDCTNPGEKIAAASINLDHASVLAHLMDVSYQGTIDHEGETFKQCFEEMSGTISGKYGLFLTNASFVALKGLEAVAASMVTLWKDYPLLAFSMTAPSHQGKGLAGFLIRKSMWALRETGHKVLYLVVTEGNTPAERLYQKIGFEFLGPAIPGRGVKEKND